MASCSQLGRVSFAHILFVACLLLGNVRACNFAASCANESLSGTTLTASCAAVNGNSVTSSLGLNAKVGNNNGQLVCPGSNFGASCSNIGLSGGHTLVANCKAVSGALVQSSLDLNKCISNNNGQLQFCV